MSPVLLNPFGYGGGGGGSGYSGAVLTDTPLAYWRHGDASGNTVADSSGNGRDSSHAGSTGITIGQTGLITGDADTCYNFNGGSLAYWQLASASWMNVSSITLEAVIKPASVSGVHLIIDRDNPATRIFQFRLNGNKIELVWWTGAGGPFVLTGATALSTGTIYHAAATYNHTTGVAKVFRNGTQDATSTVTASALPTSGLITVGANNSAGLNSFFNGDMDEVAYYGADIGSTRVAAHAALV